ncbi:MAG TPA: S41 family peptidase [Gammaproteobacteria bacterium]|nr:S41 family peptidase [Gammaproteobacteria bacterium]
MNRLLTPFFCLLLALTSLSAIASEDTNSVDQSNDEYYETQRLASVISHITHLYIREVSYRQMINNAIDGLLKNLDPHSAFLDEESLTQLNSQTDGKFTGVGIEVVRENGSLRVITPLDESPAKKAGIQAGDIITHVDGTFIHDMKMMDAINLIRGLIGSKVTLSIIRSNSGKPIDITITRDEINVSSSRSEIISNDIAYIRISSFNEPTSKEVKLATLDALKSKKIKGIVLDVRNNPGGLLNSAVEIADLFLDSKKLGKNKKIVYTKGRYEEDEYTALATNGDISKGIPLVVLINEGSASASEILAIALQEHDRAVLVGRKSFGKGSVQSVFPIDDKTAIKLTTSLYYSPKGHSIQAQGVLPDIGVPFDKFPETESTQNKESTGFLESSLSQHIKSSQSNGFEQAWKKFKTQRTTMKKMAHDDYMLYQAVLVLRGIQSYQD